MQRLLSITLAVVAVLLLSAPSVLGAGEAAVGLPRTLGGRSLEGVIGEFIRNALGLSGVAALAVFVYAGIMYLTSQGNEERVTKSKKMMVYAALGLVILFSSYSIVSFIQQRLAGTTKTGGATTTTGTGTTQ